MSRIYVIFDGMTLHRATQALTQEWEAYQHLLQTKRKCLLTTDSVGKEYARYCLARGLPATFIETSLLSDLERAGKLVFHPGSPNPVIQGLGKQHDALMKSAVSHQCKYLVRVNPDLWSDIARRIRTQYGLNILTPAQFVTQNGVD